MTHYRAARLRTSSTRPTTRVLHAAETVAWVVGAAVVTAISAQASVTLPGSPIPFTLQPVAVLGAGAMLGARLGALSQCAYLAMGVAGAAAFAWSPVLLPGVARLLGPTGGFLMAFPLAAFVVGRFGDRGWMGRSVSAWLALLAGLGALYVGGALWAVGVLPREAGVTSVIALAPYLLADLVKIALLAPVVPALRQAFER